MSVHDRDYMRKRSREHLLNPKSWTIRFLILLAAVYVLQRLSPAFNAAAPLSWQGLLAGKFWTPLTATLTHANVNHLLGNALGVFFFGRIAEQELGSQGFLRLTILTGLLGWVPYLLVQMISGDSIPTLGASGVVMAYLAVAAMRRPKETFLIWFVIPVPLWLLACVYVFADLSGASGQLRGGGTGVNHVVHLTGAAFGLWFHFSERGGLSIRNVFASVRPRQSGRNAPGFRSPGKLDPHAPDEREEVNRLLDKISEEGIGSLSDDERDFLNRASRGYR